MARAYNGQLKLTKTNRCQYHFGINTADKREIEGLRSVGFAKWLAGGMGKNFYRKRFTYFAFAFDVQEWWNRWTVPLTCIGRGLLENSNKTI